MMLANERAFGSLTAEVEFVQPLGIVSRSYCGIDVQVLLGARQSAS